MLGIVGESGCGKSVTALSILRLVQQPGRIELGSRIMFEGKDLFSREGVQKRVQDTAAINLNTRRQSVTMLTLTVLVTLTM